MLAWCRARAHWLIRAANLYAGAIAGFGYTEGPRLLERLATGEALQLVREPDNPHDPRAVRIDWNGYKLGYVPRNDNASVARRLDAGEPLNARITRVQRGADRWQPVDIEICSVVDTRQQEEELA